MIFLKTSDDFHTKLLRTSYDFLTNFSRTSYGFLTKFIKLFYMIFVQTLLKSFNDLLTNLLRTSNDFLTNFSFTNISWLYKSSNNFLNFISNSYDFHKKTFKQKILIIFLQTSCKFLKQTSYDYLTNLLQTSYKLFTQFLISFLWHIYKLLR
jgi:hypothetical protein